MAGSWVLVLAMWPAAVAAGSPQVVPDVPDTAASQPQAVDIPPDSVLATRLEAVYASFEEFDVGISVDEELQRALQVGVGTLEAMAGVMND